jgi:hypothetical protein
MGMRLAFAIAHLGGHDVFHPAVCNLAFAALTGEPGLAARPTMDERQQVGFHFIIIVCCYSILWSIMII